MAIEQKKILASSKAPQGDNINHHDEIAIVGIGCWYPGAHNSKELWENIIARRRQFRPIPDVRMPLKEYQHDDKSMPDKTYGTQAALIDGYTFDWAKHRIPKSTADSTDIVHWLALDVALQMLEDTNYTPGNLPREKTQVIVGNTLTGEFTRSNMLRLRWPFIRKLLHQSGQQLGMSSEALSHFTRLMERQYKSISPPINEDTLAGGLSNTIAGRICNYLNLHGGGYTVDGACSSSLIAVYTAATHLSNGTIDFAIAGGVDISLDPFELIGFAKVGALTPGDMSVYDQHGNGFIPGEGCGFVGMKRLVDAQRDGDKVYAILDGWGISSDGKGGITAPSVNGQSLALCRAYQRAGINADDIDFIEGHGTGTKVGDRTELLAISKALTERASTNLRSCGITSFKSIVGHTKAAAGIGAFIKAVMAVNQRVIPPTAGCEQPHDLFSKEIKSLYPILRGKLCSADKRLRAGISAMGFGGINVHATISSGPKQVADLEPEIGTRAAMASNQDSEVFCLGASSIRGLIEKTEELQQKGMDASLAELSDLAASVNPKANATAQFKAAIIARSPGELVKKLQAMSEILKQEPTIEGVRVDWERGYLLSVNKKECTLGWVFPGQGSQRPNMARALLERFEWARELVEQANDWAEQMGTSGLARAIYSIGDNAITAEEHQPAIERLRQTKLAQPAITLTSILWINYLRRLGLNADAMMGHSLGELTALHASGAYDAKLLIQIATLRGQLMTTVSTNSSAAGEMLSLACDGPRALEFIKSIPHQNKLVVANLNSPLETVVSGESKAIEALEKFATKQDIRAKRLHVSNAFHSPLVADAAVKFKKIALIKKLPLTLNSVVISSCDGQRITKDTDLLEHFANQIVSPVNFIAAVRGLQEHCDLILEVGPGAVLSQLIGQSTNKLTSIPVEGQTETFNDFNHMLGLVYVHGRAIQWNEVYGRRIIRDFVMPSERAFIVNPCERPIQSEKRDIGTENTKDLDKFTTPVVITTPEQNQQEVSSSTITNLTTSDPEQRICAIVSDFTGFDTQAISMDSNLIDDLNLDSIKTAELVGRLATAFDVQGKIDTANYATASLKKVWNDIEKVQANASETRKDTENDVETTNSDQNQPIDSLENWVRSFQMVQIPSELSCSIPNLKNCSIGLQYEPSEQFLATELSDQLKAKGANPKLIGSFFQSEATADTIDSLIIILPTKASPAYPDQNMLQACIRRLSPMTMAATRQNPIFGITYIQFGGFSTEETLGDGSVETAGTTSFAASLHLEHPLLKVRVIDFESSVEAAFAATRILTELGGKQTYSSSHYTSKGMRYTLTPKLFEPHQQTSQNIVWDKRDVVVVTGGAKGITAECAFAFAKTTGARMVLVGSSSRQTNDEINLTLKRYRTAGLSAQYAQCDIVDPIAVNNFLNEVEKELGPITGIIHGAGINRPKRLEQVDESAVLTEIAPKVLGLSNMCTTLANRPPKLIVGLTSIIGVTGMPGNAWYAFSNEILNLILQRFTQSNPKASYVALAYSVWGDIGMGARMGSIQRLSNLGISPISSEAGVTHFLRAVLQQTPNRQIIITSRLGGLDTWPIHKPQLPVANRFLQDIRIYQTEVELVAKTTLRLEDDIYLRDHNYRGSYLFPTVFGLEAMAQAVACLLEQPSLSTIEIIDIDLSRPIVVGNDGTEIQIHAIVEKKHLPSELPRIRVGISTEQTGFGQNHFSATFVMAESSDIFDETYDVMHLQSEPVQIDPKTEIYGDLLFQGSLFQRLNKVWHMESEGSLTEIIHSEPAIYFSSRYSNKLILGDPSFRDVLLQTTQLSVKGTLLPIHIASIEIFDTQNSKIPVKVLAYNNILSRTTDNVSCDVVAVNAENGRPIERLVGYTLKQMEHDEAGPSPEDWVNPGKRDAAILEQTLSKFCDTLNIQAPKYTLVFAPQMHEMNRKQRHSVEIPLLCEVAKRAIPKSQAADETEIQVRWNEDGKPFLTGIELSSINVSLSHDHRHCLYVAGEGLQGCDLEPITERSEDDWLSLLPLKQETLFRQLIAIGDTTDEAGTRLWSAIESVKKAMGDNEINVQKTHQAGRAVILTFAVNDTLLSVLTFPIRLTRPPIKMVALVVNSRSLTPQAKSSPPTESIAMVDGVLIEDRSSPQVYHQFRTTFKDTTTSQHSVNFNTIANWMGCVRELATATVAREMIEDFSSGRWGMVTNNSNINVIHPIGCMDLVEGRMQVNRAYGKHNSSVDMIFDWVKMGTDGSELVVARSNMATTWVEIIGHGQVRVRPFPSYMQKLIDSYLPDQDNPKTPVLMDEEIFSTFPNFAPGDCLYHAPMTPNIEHEFVCKQFDTTSVHSNLVGNIYYANYYHWQSHIVDLFFHNLQQLYKIEITQGAFCCVHSNVSHLREAMPYDVIELSLGIKAVYSKGIKLCIEVYRIETSGARTKLARSDHHTVWLTAKNSSTKSHTDASLYNAAEDIPKAYINILLNKLSYKPRRAIEKVKSEPIYPGL